jgi:ABC-type thiamin/hydroxymethylpyrimidine transport system permease subunit
MVKGLIWSAGQALIGVFSLGFLLVGIDLCRAAFHLKEPYQFILTLFASNLIILISAALCAGVIVRTISRLKGRYGTRTHAAVQDETEPSDC